MKVLLKKEVCGFRELCTGPIGYSKMRFSKKKKKCRCKDVDASQMHTKCVFGKN